MIKIDIEFMGLAAIPEDPVSISHMGMHQGMNVYRLTGPKTHVHDYLINFYDPDDALVQELIDTFSQPA